jgi:hypothetical protein
LAATENKSFVPDESFNPIQRFVVPKLTPKEEVMKKEIDTYHVSDVDNTAVIYFGADGLSVIRSLELSDAECEGLVYKQRLVATEAGDCLLLARWKPDRYMRRTAPMWAQKWFIEKKLYPQNADRLFDKLEKSAEPAEA